MQNLKLCDPGSVNHTLAYESAVKAGKSRTGESFEAHMKGIAESRMEPDVKKEVAQKLAGVFYSMLFRAMKNTIFDGEENEIGDGVNGLIERFLPDAMAGAPSDPITPYIGRTLNLEARGGIDERA